MNQEPSTFASVLSEAIKQRGLTLERIKHKLDQADVSVSIATLSYWQNGRSQPTRAHSQPIVVALERVLELPPGTLSSVARAQQVKRRWSARQEGLTLPQTVEQLLDETGMDLAELRKVSTHLTLNVTVDRTRTFEVVRNVVQSMVEGAQRVPIVVAIDPETDIDQQVQAMSNCTVGTVYEVPEHELVLTELKLPRPLRQGECLMYEYMTSWAPGTDDEEGLQIAVPKINELVLEVQFDPHVLPSRVVAFTGDLAEDDPGLDAPDSVDLPLWGGLAQVVRRDVAAGVYCLGWQW